MLCSYCCTAFIHSRQTLCPRSLLQFHHLRRRAAQDTDRKHTHKNPGMHTHTCRLIWRSHAPCHKAPAQNAKYELQHARASAEPVLSIWMGKCLMAFSSRLTSQVSAGCHIEDPTMAAQRRFDTLKPAARSLWPAFVVGSAIQLHFRDWGGQSGGGGSFDHRQILFNDSSGLTGASLENGSLFLLVGRPRYPWLEGRGCSFR